MYQTIGDISVFVLSGDLDDFYGKQLLKSLVRLIQTEWVKIILDFKHVGHVNFKVMTDLISLMVAAHSMNGYIKIANLNPYHRSILKASGIEDFFETDRKSTRLNSSHSSIS